MFSLIQGLVVKFLPVRILLNDGHSRTRVQLHFQRFPFCFQIDPDYITTQFARIVYLYASQNIFKLIAFAVLNSVDLSGLTLLFQATNS